jgi:hypothetical protein
LLEINGYRQREKEKEKERERERERESERAQAILGANLTNVHCKLMKEPAVYTLCLEM